MKIVISDPVTVLQGPVERNTFWGIYQFPMVRLLSNGCLLYSVNVVKDSVHSYNKPGTLYFASIDHGTNWERIANEDAEKYLIESKTLLPNGDRIWFEGPKTVPTYSVRLPKPLGKAWTPHVEVATAYPLEGIDEAFDTSWHLMRLKAGETEPRMEKIQPKWPYRHAFDIDGQLVTTAPCPLNGKIDVRPDGTLLMASYTSCSRNPKNGGFNPYCAAQLFRSEDNGHNWELINQQMYVPDTDVIPNAFNMEGFSENSLLFCPDGSMVRLLRCGGSYFPDSYGPMFFQRSIDGGYTWTKPEIFDDHGVVPHGVTLGCGVTIVTYGRYGVQIRATDDPSCMKWDTPIELLANEWSWPESDGSCSNNCLISLNDHKAGIAYSDFTYRNKDGFRIKSLMYRTITVE